MGSQQAVDAHLREAEHGPRPRSICSVDASCEAKATRGAAVCLIVECCAPASNTAPTTRHKQSVTIDIRLMT
jgi:hypothetical protein